MALRNAFANLALETKQDTANTHLATIAGLGLLTNTQLRATALPISGSVSVTGNVTVTNGLDVDILTMPAITGTVSVSNFPASQAVTGSVSVSNFPVSQAVTGTFFQATQPVSGTFFQATQPVSILTMPTTPVTGTFFQATQPVSGTVTVSGVSTEATLAALNTKTPALGQALMAASQPVTIASNQSALAVTGTFFQVTQPVSGTVTVGNASLAVTGSFFQATQPVSGPLTNTELRAVGVPVTGTFFQATQPVSILSMPTTAVTGTFFQATQPVSGTFFQATQPVSGSVTQIGNSLVSTANSTIVNLAAAAVFTGTSEDVSEYSDISVTVFASHATATDGLSLQQSVDGTNWDITDVYSIAAATAGNGKIFHLGVSARFYRLVYTNGATLTTSLRIQTIFSKQTKRGSSVRPSDGRGNDNDFEETSAYLSYFNGTTWDRARGSAKGVQPSSALGVQDLKDAGRVSYAISTVIAGVTAVTAEALLSMVPVRDGVAAAAATSFGVTAAKRFRVQAIHLSGLTTGAAVLSARISLRMTPTGAVTATSPIIATVGLNGPAAVALTGDSQTIDFPDGFEISGTQQIGLTQVAAAITGTLRASIIGFEY